jgi:hypothetical protein
MNKNNHSEQGAHSHPSFPPPAAAVLDTAASSADYKMRWAYAAFHSKAHLVLLLLLLLLLLAIMFLQALIPDPIILD